MESNRGLQNLAWTQRWSWGGWSKDKGHGNLRCPPPKLRLPPRNKGSLIKGLLTIVKKESVFMSHDYLTFEGCEGGSWLEPFGIPLVWKGGFWYTCYRVLKGGGVQGEGVTGEP